jgi:hypothetical protein
MKKLRAAAAEADLNRVHSVCVACCGRTADASV